MSGILDIEPGIKYSNLPDSIGNVYWSEISNRVVIAIRFFSHIYWELKHKLTFKKKAINIG